MINWTLGITGAILEAGEGRNTVELVKSASEKHLDLLRPSARYYSVSKGSLFLNL